MSWCCLDFSHNIHKMLNSVVVWIVSTTCQYLWDVSWYVWIFHNIYKKLYWTIWTVATMSMRCYRWNNGWPILLCATLLFYKKKKVFLWYVKWAWSRDYEPVARDAPYKKEKRFVLLQRQHIIDCTEIPGWLFITLTHVLNMNISVSFHLWFDESQRQY